MMKKIFISLSFLISFNFLSESSYADTYKNKVNFKQEYNYLVAYNDCKKSFLSERKTSIDILSIAHPTSEYYDSTSYYDSYNDGYILSIDYKSAFTGKILNIRLLVKYSYGFFSINRVLSDSAFFPAFSGFDSVINILMSDVESEYKNTPDTKKSTIVKNLIELWRDGNLTATNYISGIMTLNYLDYSCY